MSNYRKDDIRSIDALICENGGRRLTPVFFGHLYPIMIPVTAKEFQVVKESKDLMKDLAIKKLNGTK